jgi:hypothetical protein
MKTIVSSTVSTFWIVFPDAMVLMRAAALSTSKKYGNMKTHDGDPWNWITHQVVPA